MWCGVEVDGQRFYEQNRSSKNSLSSNTGPVTQYMHSKMSGFSKFTQFI